MKGLPIVFRELEVAYGAALILRGVSASIRPGALTALIGSNGSGKSTLLRTLAGLLPYKGLLTLNEQELSSVPRRELGKRVGVVPQQARMAAPFTVYEAVSLGRLPYRGLTSELSDEDDKRIQDAVVLAGVEHLLFREANRLSGGETQQVLLATVLAQNPPVLLLDEPTSALDPRRTIRTFALLRRLAAEGRTVIAAVHDVNLAVAFADDFLALKDGELLFGGSAAQLDGKMLEELYETPFMSYASEEGGIAWHAFTD